MLPLTLTLLSEAFPAGRRGVALGIWSGVSGLGVALGPVIGGAVVSGISWHWIFWINVPIGLVVAPLALARLTESRGPNKHLDLPGVALASGGLLGIVYALVRANALGWTSATVLASAIAGIAAARSVRRLGAAHGRTPMLPMRFFRSRAFSATNGVSLAMYFGMFGAIFLLAQFFQTAQGYSPLAGRPAHAAVDGDADLRRAARRAALGPHRQPPADVRRARAAGDRARVARHRAQPDARVRALIVPFMLAGAGMALVFAPVRQRRARGGARRGGRPGLRRDQRDPRGRRRARRRRAGLRVQRRRQLRHAAHAFVAGLTPAVTVAAVVLALGALAALAIPGVRRRPASVRAQGELAVEVATGAV